MVSPVSRSASFAIIVALWLSGCVAEAPGDEREPATDAAITFTAYETGTGCPSLCEPVVVTDGKDVYVKGATFARGVPGQMVTFEPPPPPAHLGPGTFQTDRHLDVDAEGRLWFSALIANGQALGAVFSLTGVQVARSDDGGQTWALDRYLGLASSTPTDASGADRQWLGFGPDGTAWLTFQRNSPVSVLGRSTADAGNVWIASSRDGGDTWSEFAPLDNEEGSGHATGRMTFDGDRPLVPVHKSTGTPGLYVFAPGEPPVRVRDAGSFFPAMARWDGGAVFAVMDAERTLQVLSWDGSTITPLWNGTPGAMISSPWIDVRDDGGYDVVWLERVAGTEDRFDVLWSRAGAAPRVVAADLRGDQGVRATTDFAHFAYHQGRLLIVVGDNDAATTTLYWETPTAE